MVDYYRDYVGADTAFVPMGGETCAVDPPRSECLSAIAEMLKLHFSYINREFQADVLASWLPCMSEIDKRLGYRLLLKSAELPSAVKPGGSFTLTVNLENQGFAAPFNARPVFVVLRGGGMTTKVQLTKADPRRWLKKRRGHGSAAPAVATVAGQLHAVVVATGCRRNARRASRVRTAFCQRKSI